MSTSSTQSKSHPRSRRWVFTLPADEYDEAYVSKSLGKYKAVIGQLETGASGYDHWQLYMEHSSPVRFSVLKHMFPKGHFEKAKTPRISCVRYVTKEDTFAGTRIELGSIDLSVKQGKRTDLDSYTEQIMLKGRSADDVMYEDPRSIVYANHLRQLELVRDRKEYGSIFRNVEVHYIHGATRTGKTSAIFESFGYDACYRVPNWKNPFDGYKGQEILVLDEYNTSVAIVDLLKVLEGYPLEVSARYADKVAKFTKVFIISNLPLRQQHVKIQEEHPEQYEAFLARLTSVSEMVVDGKLIVSKGTPPQLDHFLTGKPVEVVVSDSKPATPEPAVDVFDDLDDVDDLESVDIDDLFD